MEPINSLVFNRCIGSGYYACFASLFCLSITQLCLVLFRNLFGCRVIIILFILCNHKVLVDRILLECFEVMGLLIAALERIKFFDKAQSNQKYFLIAI